MNSSIGATPIPSGVQNSAPVGVGGESTELTVRLGSGCQPVPAPRPVPAAPAALSGFPQVTGYEILGIVGVGGMGIVYKARHRELNRVVALKMLGREWETDLDSRERFRAEAEAVAKLQHPNIIQLFDIGTCERGPGAAQPYMSLEYVDGSNLSRYTGTPQEPWFAALMVEKVARAAGAAHRLGVIHRDLKPANVLLTVAGEPKIADFGLAKHLEPKSDGSGRYHTQAGTVVGTPEYMAPEQVDGLPPTPAVDVYALGVMLYELLTGRVPFKGASLTDTLLMVRGVEPVPPRRLQPNLPRDLETICLTCLAKSPDKRYATAEALADDLARWSAGKAIQARPAGRVERAGRWARRNPAVAGLLAFSLFVLVAGVTGVVWKWREAAATAAVERWERYRADLRAAASALHQGNAAAARRALEDAPAEHRSWEWDVLTAQLDVSSRVLRVPQLESSRVVPARGRVVTYTRDQTLRQWGLAAGTEAVPAMAVEGAAYWAYSADGALAATVGADHVIRVRPFAGGPERRLVGHTGPVTAVHFAADGGRLVSSSRDGSVRAWDLSAERAVAVYQHTASLFIHDLTPDGRRLVVSNPDRSLVALWDTDSDRLIPLGEGRRYSGGQFSPDGRYYVAGAEYPENDLQLIDAVTGAHVAPLHGHANTTTKVAFSDDGKTLATGSMDRTACLWDVPACTLRATLRGHTGWVTAVAFSPDGTRVVTGSTDKTLRLWTAAGDPLAILRGHDGDIHEVAFSADGRELYSSSADETLRTWEVATAERRGLLRGHTDFVYDVVHHPDNRRALSASWDGTAALWDTATGQRIRQFSHPKRLDPRTGKSRVNYVTSVAVHPNGRLAATVGRLDAVTLWDLTAGGENPPPLHAWDVPTDDWRVSRVAFAPVGSLLACGGKGGKVRLFDWRTKAAVAELDHPGAVVEALAFSPDGRWLVSSSAETLRVWDAASRRLVTELNGHEEGVNGLAFNATGKTLASAASDGTVRLWTVADWSAGPVLRHGGVKVYSVDFHPDGTRLATGCSDTSIRLWDVQRGEEVAELRGHHEYVHAVAFSPDGKRLVSGSGDKTLRVWDTVPVGKAGR